MKAIPNFTSIETTNEGLRKLQLLIDERTGWGNPTQIYSDEFYLNCLTLRMENCNKLDFAKNVIQVAAATTFAEAKATLHKTIKLIQDKQYMNLSRIFNTSDSESATVELLMDLISTNFHGATLQSTPDGPPRAATLTRNNTCFNGKVPDHTQFF